MNPVQLSKFRNAQAIIENLAKEMTADLANSKKLTEPQKLRLGVEIGGLSAARAALETVAT
jgi:hypothetical protein